jgi:hypothetical protein
MFGVSFWRGAVERAVKTAAQFALVAFGADTVSVISVDWQGVAAAAAAGFVVSVLTSLGSEPFGPMGSPSLVFSDET